VKFEGSFLHSFTFNTSFGSSFVIAQYELALIKANSYWAFLLAEFLTDLANFTLTIFGYQNWRPKIRNLADVNHTSV
jgi:hypothetical protein